MSEVRNVIPMSALYRQLSGDPAFADLLAYLAHRIETMKNIYWQEDRRAVRDIGRKKVKHYEEFIREIKTRVQSQMNAKEQTK